MRRLGLVLAGTLLILNTAGVGWLVLQSRREHKTILVGDRSLEQLNRLFRLVGEYQAELEKVGLQAPFPDDAKRKEWKDLLRWRELGVEGTRIAYLNAQREGTAEALGLFLGLARLSVTTPTATFSAYDTKTFKSTTFANTSRLESLENDFDVLMVELLRDLK